MLQIYKASAGSGKTYNLAREYIKILLAVKQPDGTYRLRPLNQRPHEHILAITFTNKATGEMTERIIRELAILARVVARKDGRKSDYHDGFVKEFGCTDDELVRAAWYALFTLLSDYNYFNVSTIDSFFQNVLRIFTRELDLSDDFNLELDDTYTITLGIHEMFRALNYEYGADEGMRARINQIRKWLYEYMIASLEEGKSFNIFSKSGSIQRDIIQSIRSFMDETFRLNSRGLREYFDDGDKILTFNKALQSAQSRIAADLQRHAAEFLPYLDNKGIDGRLRLKSSFARFAVGDWGKAGRPVAMTESQLGLCINTRRMFKESSEPDPEIIARYCTYVARHMQAVSYIIGIDKMRRQVYNLGLLGCVLSFLERYCRENNSILLSETNNLLHEFIKDEDTPFVYERLGVYLRHFLLDEFQDTSVMQWDNLRPLLLESLSHREDYDNLIIGDEKQCIYRFRNADPELLGYRVAEEVTGRYGDGSIRDRGMEGKDNTNWRSSREVVKFNNTIFKALAYVLDRDSSAPLAMPEVDKALSVADYYRLVAATGGHSRPRLNVAAVYANVVQEVAKTDYRGYVRMSFMPGDYMKVDAADALGSDTADDDMRELKDRERFQEFGAMTVIGEIDRQLSAGYKPRDIAVLVRTHSEGEFFIGRLREVMRDDGSWHHGSVEIVSADAIGLDSSPTVRLIIAVLRQYVEPFVDEESNTETKSGKRRLDLQRRINDLHNRYEYYRADAGISRSEALALALRHARADYEDDDPIRLSDSQIRQRAADAADMQCPSLVSLVERIVSCYVSPASCRRDAAFIMEFQDVVLDYENLHGSDLSSFIEWWDRMSHKLSLNSPSGIDAITVMTIHQSKGLEFKCVHLPFMNIALYEPHSSFKRSIDWYTIDPQVFGEYIDPDCLPPMMPLENVADLEYTVAFGDQYRDIVSRKRIDVLNVVYVAMTRAVEELVVCVGPSSMRNHDDDLEHWLREAISASSVCLEGESVDRRDRLGSLMLPLADSFDGDTIIIGEPRTCPEDFRRMNPVVSDEVGGDDVSVTQIYMPGYYSREDDETITVADEYAGPFDYTDQRQRGRLLHRVMQHVIVADDLPLALRREAYRTGLSDGLYDECLAMLSRAIEDVADRGWFGDNRRVLTERTVSLDGNNYRPDRIVWLPDGSVHVIDYKFTEPPVSDEDARKRHNRYCRQVSRYVGMLVKAGYRRVKGYVWYVDEGNVVPCVTGSD